MGNNIVFVRLTIQQWARDRTRRKEPRSSRPSALSVTLSRRVDHTSKDRIFTAFSDANPDKPMVTLIHPPTKSLDSRSPKTVRISLPTSRKVAVSKNGGNLNCSYI